MAWYSGILRPVERLKLGKLGMVKLAIAYFSDAITYFSVAYANFSIHKWAKA